MSQYFTGLDDLRAQLEANGWRMKTAEALRLPSKQLELL